MGNQRIVIENIKPEDVPEIVKIGLSTKEFWVDDNDVYYSEESILDFLNSKDDIHLKARLNDEIVGYRLAVYNKYLKEGYLIDMVVKEKYRRMGVGTLLYKETLKELKSKGCQWVWALVKESNINMQSFIEKQGFNKGKSFYFYYMPDLQKRDLD